MVVLPAPPFRLITAMVSIDPPGSAPWLNCPRRGGGEEKEMFPNVEPCCTA